MQRVASRLTVVTVDNICVFCRVGEHAAERASEQPVEVSLRLTLAQPEVAADTLAGTVNYKAVEEQVRDLLSESACVTIERLVDMVGQLCLDRPEVREAWVKAVKPKKIAGTGPVGVECTFSRVVATPTLSLLVLVCEDVAATQAFYEVVGLTFTAERHGRGPWHQVSTDLGFVLELYPRHDGEDGVVVDQRRLGIKVPNYDQVVAALDAKKVRHKGKQQGAAFVDPDGRVVVIEPL